MPEEEFRVFVNSHSWTFAKTAKRNPHEYIVRGRLSPVCGAQFDAVCNHIAENGYLEVFWGEPYICYAFGGHKYWSIEDILNRDWI